MPPKAFGAWKSAGWSLGGWKPLLRRKSSSPVVSALASASFSDISGDEKLLPDVLPLPNEGEGKEMLPGAEKSKLLVGGAMPPNNPPEPPNCIDCCTFPFDFRGIFRCLPFGCLIVRVASWAALARC